MATELSMNGRKKIETIQKEFSNKFPVSSNIFGLCLNEIVRPSPLYPHPPPP